MILSVSLSTFLQFIELGLPWKIEQESLMSLLAFPVRHLKTRERKKQAARESQSNFCGGNSGINNLIIYVGRCQKAICHEWIY